MEKHPNIQTHTIQDEVEEEEEKQGRFPGGKRTAAKLIGYLIFVSVIASPRVSPVGPRGK